MVWCFLLLGGIVLVLALGIAYGVPLPRPQLRPGTMLRGCVASVLILIAGILIVSGVLLGGIG